jgi:hypothetical protein
MVQIYRFIKYESTYQDIYYMNYVIEGIGALVNEKGEEQPNKEASIQTQFHCPLNLFLKARCFSFACCNTV